ncbi:MAG: ADP-ribose pyrophosphatase [Frankiales bacterium]|nr:ADP-ribose pyrophosphatase [Frankiales bacterium]
MLTLRSDEVAMPGGASSQRDVTELPGAVAIVPLHADGTVVLVRQYRHPVARHLLEVPAGLLDSTTESAQEAGERELLEEAGLRAGRWETLADVLTTPGMSDETIRLLLARDLTAVPAADRPDPLHEEADMQVVCMPLAQAIELVLDGELENGITAAALLAAHVALSSGRALRPADAPWLARKR